MPRWLEWLGAVLIFLTVALSAAFQQQPAKVTGDAAEYYRMAEQYRFGHTAVSVDAPFVFRPLTPLLATYADAILKPAIPRWLDAAIVDATWVRAAPGFYAVNLAAALAATILLVAYLRCFVPSAALRLVLVTFWLIQWHTPVRYTFFTPVNVEPLFLAFVTGGLLTIERMRGARLEWQVLVSRHSDSWHESRSAAPGSQGARSEDIGHIRTTSNAARRDAPPANYVANHCLGTLVITLIVFVGVFAREAMALVAATFIAMRWRVLPKGPDRLLVVVPVLGAGAAIALTHVMNVTLEPYQPWTEMMAVVSRKPLWTWVLAWFYTFGPVALAIIGSALPTVRDVLRARPELGVYLAGCALLAFFGGTDTERILGWGYPVMLVLLGTAINARMSVFRAHSAIAIAMMAAVLVSARVFWPIPSGPEETATPFSTLEPSWHGLMVLLDKFFVIENYYSNLWSYFGSRSVHLTVLVVDVVLASGLARFLARQHARLSLLRTPAARA